MRPPPSSFASAEPVRCLVIGGGTFGASLVAQAAYAPGLHVVAVVDANHDMARAAFVAANIPRERIVVCGTQEKATAAYVRRDAIVAADARLLMELPIEVVAECTGHPDAGAAHALLAIEHGKHVAMVNKETDATVGPILKRLADEAHVVYTAVDGDQHGMAIGLVDWARALGLEVLAAGKILDREMTFDPDGGIEFKGQRITVPDDAKRWFLPSDDATTTREHAAARSKFLGDVGRIDNWDLCELAIMANGTGLPPNAAGVHCPIAYTTEIPRLLCPRDIGGLLERRGVIDAVRLLRQPHEAGLGGGVFAVVTTPSESVRDMMNSKGMIHHRTGEASLLLRPHHLLGVEAIYSIIAAARMRVPTGATTYRPLFDVIYSARRALKAGERVGDDHSRELQAHLVPAVRLDRNDPLPAHLASENLLARDVAAGEMIRRDDMVRPGVETIWSLRERQENLPAREG